MNTNPIFNTQIFKKINESSEEEVELSLLDYVPKSLLEDSVFSNFITSKKSQLKINRKEALERIEYFSESLDYMTTFIRESFASSVFSQTYDKASPPKPEEILEVTCFNGLVSDKYYADLKSMDKRYQAEGLQEKDIAYQKVVGKAVALIIKAMVVSYKTGVEDQKEGRADAELLKM